MNRMNARLVCVILASCFTGILVLGANAMWILAELPPSPVPSAAALVVSVSLLVYTAMK